MNPKLNIAAGLSAMMLLSCCSSGREAQTSASKATAGTESENTALITDMKVNNGNGYRAQPPRGTSAAMPKAVIYRTNGDYRLNVPITLDASRSSVVSYPAPTDISPDMEPLCLADGWLLDRRGVSENTAFTTYTYSSYMTLPSAPSPQQLLESVIPSARVVSLKVLPITLSEAVADTTAVNTMIRTGNL